MVESVEEREILGSIVVVDIFGGFVERLSVKVVVWRYGKVVD